MEKPKTEKPKISRKAAALVGGLAMLVLLPACGAAGIMDPTERAPRSDPAVESGQVENPVEIRDEEETLTEDQPENRQPEERPSEQPDDDMDEDREFQAPPPAAGPDGSKGKGAKGEGVSSEMFGNLEPLSDGARQVGEAGEVDFRVENGVLNLVDVSANSGWDYQLGKQGFDEVKVFFIGDNTRWEFEAEIDDGYLLEVETKQEIPSAEPGSYEVGDAGEVAFSARNGGIILDDYSVADGWSANIEENDFEDVHLRFSDQSGVEYKFEAEFDDGFIEVNIDRKEVGTLATS